MRHRLCCTEIFAETFQCLAQSYTLVESRHDCVFSVFSISLPRICENGILKTLHVLKIKALNIQSILQISCTKKTDQEKLTNKQQGFKG